MHPHPATHEVFGGVAGSLGPLGNGRGGFTSFVDGSAASVFAHGGALVNMGRPDTLTYAYTDPAHVHAVTSVSGLGTFTYDANGNMTLRVEDGTTYTQTFDVENRLVSVAVSGGGTTQYQYNAGGQMLKKIAPDGTVTVYLGLVEYEIAGGVTQTTSYYTVPGARVVRVDSALSYVLTDHLGSSSVTLDDAGNVDGELRYYAYGETRVSSGSTPTERLYTGQLGQPDIVLYYYNARWYSSYLNRWIQPDVIVPEPGNPQSFNRYSYVYNAPLNYTDPSGHAAICMCDGIGIGGLYRAYYAGSYGRGAQADAMLVKQLDKFFDANVSCNVATSSLPDLEKSGAALVQTDVISRQWREANLPGIADAVESFDIGDVTLQGGYGASGFLGAGLRGDVGFAIDGEGGVGFTVSFGGGGYSAAGVGNGGYFTVYDAPSVTYLNGWSVQVGGQVGQVGTVGAEKILFLGPDRNQYGGTSVSGAARLEVHGPENFMPQQPILGCCLLMFQMYWPG